VERDREAAQATSTTSSRALAANPPRCPSHRRPDRSYRLNPELKYRGARRELRAPRSALAGRGQASFGLTLQQLHFTSLDGRSLRDGSLITRRTGSPTKRRRSTSTS
jgi:hypothetical protein